MQEIKLYSLFINVLFWFYYYFIENFYFLYFLLVSLLQQKIRIYIMILSAQVC